MNNDMKELLKITDVFLKLNTVFGDNNMSKGEYLNEGWLLRLFMKWYSLVQSEMCDNIQFPFLPKSSKFLSEAQLRSVFISKKGFKGIGESNTKIDGLIGNFEIRKNTKTGIEVLEDSDWLVGIEAKIEAPLSSGVTVCDSYNQAARTIATLINEASIFGNQKNNTKLDYVILTKNIDYNHIFKFVEPEEYSKPDFNPNKEYYEFKLGNTKLIETIENRLTTYIEKIQQTQKDMTPSKFYSNSRFSNMLEKDSWEEFQKDYMSLIKSYKDKLTIYVVSWNYLFNEMQETENEDNKLSTKLREFLSKAIEETK